MNKTQVGSTGSNAEVSNLSALVAAQQKQIESLISALSGRGRSGEGEARRAAPSGEEMTDYNPANHVVDDLEPLPSNEQIEAAQKAAAGLTKSPVKINRPVRRI